MKKIFTTIVCCISLFIFSGCVTISASQRSINIPMEEIVSIEVYYLDEPVYDRDGRWEQYSYQDEQEIFIPYEAEPIGRVKQEDYAQFIADYEQLPFMMTIIIGAAMDPAWYYTGYVFKINTEETYYIYASGAGGSLAYCEDDVWEEFLKKYIGSEPFENVGETA